MIGAVPNPTTIVRVDAAAFDVDLSVPFAIAGGDQPRASNVLVTVTLADGTRGFGEAAPFPAVTGETQTSTLAAVAALTPVAVGAQAGAWRKLAAALHEAAPRAKAARCALEVATLDALTKRARLSLLAFFGGMQTTLETGMTVTTGSVDEAAAATRSIGARGISTFKVKVGAGDWRVDADRVAAVRREAPRGRILLDGNAAFRAGDALALLAELERRGIPVALFEQPVAADDLDGLAAVARGSSVPVCADESVTTPQDAIRLVEKRACSAFNVKLMKSGVADALAIAAIARAAGFDLMIGGMVETVLAMSASACLAAGLGGFAFVDLDTPLFMTSNPFDGGYAQRGATLDLAPIAAGHGVVPRTP